jgi:uncharacterized protein involved in exopolysaccharide biosynthesis
MSLFGRAEKRELAYWEALDAERTARIRELKKALDSVTSSREGSTRREGDMADRIISLERQLATVRAEHAAELEQLRGGRAAESDNVAVLRRELDIARRRLAATQKQLDDATCMGDLGWESRKPSQAGAGEGR